MTKSVTKPKSRTVKGKITKRSAKIPKHQVWTFKPRLENEAIVLHSILDTYSVETYASIVQDIRNLITQLVQQHGFTDGAKRYNIIKNYTISLIEMRNPTNPSWVSTSEKFKIPSKLGVNFTQLIADYFLNTDTDYQSKYFQVILTILNIVRMVEGLSDADFTSVTDKPKQIDELFLDEFEAYVSNRLNPHKYDPDSTSLKAFRFNLMKKGPNGQPKIESAYEEAVCLLNSKLSRPFEILCSEMKCTYLFNYLSELKVLSDTDKQEHPVSEHTKLRKLVSVPDSGFKTRIVAIVDFWTQLILEPVRVHVQTVIQKEFGKTDFRLNQDGGVAAMVDFQKSCMNGDIVREHQLDICSLKFYDISSWTDRFHRDLQKITMKHLFSPRLMESWAQLVVHCPWYVGGQIGTVKYGQGQGMGTNGSFDIATLTDHLLINFIIDKKSTLKGIFPKNRCYGKVGDDLWIYDPENLIPEFYEKINLPINFSKSKEYSEVGSTAEFCSRTFLNGVDVSRISPRIINRSKDFRYIPTLLGLCSSRGILLDRASFPKLNNIVKDEDITYFDKLQPWIISLICLGVKERSLAKHLTVDYLMEGHWITDSTLELISDPQKLSKLSIAHNIVSIANSVSDVKTKMSETMKVQFSVPWGDWTAIADSNFFMDDKSAKEWRAFFKIDRVLLPREIILLERLVDQYHSIQEMPNDMLELQDEGLTPITILAEKLNQISVRSVYDRGNINYDVKRVYSDQFAIVKTLENLNEDFTVLTLKDSDSVMNVKQMLLNDLNGQGWGKELPRLETSTFT